MGLEAQVIELGEDVVDCVEGGCGSGEVRMSCEGMEIFGECVVCGGGEESLTEAEAILGI